MISPSSKLVPALCVLLFVALGAAVDSIWVACAITIAAALIGIAVFTRATGHICSFGTAFISLLTFYHVFPVVYGQLNLEFGGLLEREIGRKESIVSALWLVLISIAATVVGYCLSPKRKRAVPAVNPTSKWSRYGGVLVVLFGVTCILAFITANGLWTASYTEFWIATRGITADPALGFLMVVGYVGISAGFSICIDRIARGDTLVPLLFGAAVCAPIVLYGFRGIVVITMLLAMSEWTRRGRGGRFFGLGVALLVLTVMMPLVVDMRSRFDQQTTQLTRLERTATEASGTMKAVVYCLERIEGGQTDYWLGRSFVASALRVLPFSSRWIEFVSDVDARPALWSLMEVNRWKLERGLGEGFSAVAEAYLNFGPIGVFVIFGVFGALLGRIDADARMNIPNTAGVVTAIWLVWWIRNDSEAVIRPLLWSMAIVITYMMILGKTREGRIAINGKV